jgi:hypothetical protein
MQIKSQTVKLPKIKKVNQENLPLLGSKINPSLNK